MSDKLVSLMREATAQRHVQWEEPAALRRRAGRRKAGRRAAVALVSVAALGAGGGVALAPAGPAACVGPVPVPSVPDLGPETVVSVSLPSVRVYHNAIGVAGNVAFDLRQRGFYVPEAGSTDESVWVHSAVIRYGPGTEEDARLVRDQLVPDLVDMEFDPARRETSVDLILGTRFRGLAPLC